MKKRNVSLNNIISIRTYRELIARKDLIEARKPYVAIQHRLAVLREQQSCNTVVLQDVSNQATSKKDIDIPTATSNGQIVTEQNISVLNMLVSMSHYAKCIKSLQHKARTVKEETTPVYDNYMISKNKLETICILQRNFKRKEKTRKEKKRLADLMEMIYC